MENTRDLQATRRMREKLRRRFQAQVLRRRKQVYVNMDGFAIRKCLALNGAHQVPESHWQELWEWAAEKGVIDPTEGLFLYWRNTFVPRAASFLIKELHNGIVPEALE